jgi:putative NADH-flavin reductase
VRPIAEACAAQRAAVLGRTDASWSHLCPPPELGPGRRTGHYRLGSDTLILDAGGRSRISMEDLAVALVDEAETGAHTGRSFTVAW